MRTRTGRWQVYKYGRSCWIALPPIGEYCPSNPVGGEPDVDGYVYWDWEDAYGLAYERACFKEQWKDYTGPLPRPY